MTACGWVDSTGSQTDPNGQTRTLIDGGQLLLLEGSPRAAQFVSELSNTRDWQWQSLGAGDANTCSVNSGFDTNLAANSLREACTNIDDCNIEFNENVDSDTTTFSIIAPSIKAPVAVQYRANNTDDQGIQQTVNQTLCLVAINEAPEAIDDEYTILSNLTREVRANDPDSLLANDKDDLDVRNQPLSVNPVPISAPKFAVEFRLGTDGSFSYTPSNLSEEDRIIEDEFVYLVTDGVHRVSATAKLRIVASNTAPIRTQRTDLIAVSEEEHADDGFSVDLSVNFNDPDNDKLFFSTTAGSLPASGNIQMTQDGILQGNPQRADVGDYIVTVIASDGIGQAADTFILSITRFAQVNSPPTVDDVPNRTVRNSFSYNVAQYFDDEDEDDLTFSAANLPTGVTISPAGLITGSASSQNRGVWIIPVTAEDGRGGSATDSFRLIIR